MKNKKLLLLLASSALVACVLMTACRPAETEKPEDPPSKPTPHAHDYVATEVLDCVRGDYTLYECDCGASYKSERSAEATGHAMANGECSRCHAKETKGLAVTVNGGSATVTGLGTASGDEVIIPATHDGVPVTAIGEEAFKAVTSVKWFTIPSSVTTIADGAFYDCDGLEEIWLSAGLTAIGADAFGVCDKLARITLPDTLKTVGAYAFSTCHELTKLNIPASVESIGTGFISYNDKLKTVSAEAGNTHYKVVNNCVVEIATGKLLGAGNGAKIPVDGSVTEICDEAFAGLTGLGEQIIPESVITLGENIFAYSDITGLTVNGTLTDFDVNILKGCQSLSKLKVSGSNYKYDSVHNCIIDTETKTLVKGCATSVIPDDGSVTAIGYNAFAGCTALTDIEIPHTVTQIGNYAFANTGLTEITLPSSLTAKSISSMGSAFKNCNRLKSVVIEEGVKVIGENMFNGCASLTEIVIPDSVTAIGAAAFNNCSSLIRITLGKNLTKIESRAFEGCNHLYECYNLSDTIAVTAGSADTTVNGGLDGVVRYLHTDKSEASRLIAEGEFVFVNDGGVYGLIAYTGNSENLVLPAACKGSGYIIPESAFAKTAYKSLTINGGVTEICDKAFSSAELQSVYIKTGALKIGKGAFQGCGNAKTLTILSDNLTLADKYSIRMLHLTELTLSNVTLPAQLFYNFTELEKVTLTNVEIGSACFFQCSALKRVEIDGGSIGEQAFYGLAGLNKVTLGGEVKLIGAWAFYGCELTEVVMQNKQWTISSDGQSYDITVEAGKEIKFLTDYSGYSWKKKQ